MTFRVTFNAHNGLAGIPRAYDARGAARDAVARRIRSARLKGQPVGTIELGASWEFGEPEDAVMIGDDVGVLVLHVVADDERCEHGYYVDDCVACDQIEADARDVACDHDEEEDGDEADTEN
jgi:hypothetical protein